jgi:ATP-dependent DNA ligase
LDVSGVEGALVIVRPGQGTGERSMMSGELLLGVWRGARENLKVCSTGNAKERSR